MTEQGRAAVRMLLLWSLLELIAAAQVRVPGGSGSLLVSWARGTVAPLRWTASWTASAGADLYHGVRDVVRLINTLHQTREELDRVRAENLLLREDLAAADEARQVLPLATRGGSSSRLARCSYRNVARGFMQVSTAEGGSVALNTVAVSGDGLVGRVVWSRGTTSSLQLITHPAAAVAVRAEESGVQGLLTGSGQQEMELEYVPRNARLVRGDILVTSGADGVYPPGLPVAAVSSIRETEAAFLEVKAVPTAALTELRLVLLLPEWSIAQEGATAP